MSSERILKLQTENVDTLSRLFGLNEENIAIIEQAYQIEIICRQDELVLKDCDEKAYQSISSLLKLLLALCQEAEGR